MNVNMMKNNRTTTYESLLAFVGVILAETKEQFCHYYELATHDNAGASIWYYVSRTSQIYDQERRKEDGKKEHDD